MRDEVCKRNIDFFNIDNKEASYNKMIEHLIWIKVRNPFYE